MDSNALLAKQILLLSNILLLVLSVMTVVGIYIAFIFLLKSGSVADNVKPSVLLDLWGCHLYWSLVHDMLAR